MRKLSVVGRILGLVMGLYLIARAVAEPFVIDMSDPATYRDDWGGPSLAGVLAVHCGPGLLAVVIIVLRILRRRSPRSSTQASDRA
jgi:hypothetical protein